jgi:hypothetical protein
MALYSHAGLKIMLRSFKLAYNSLQQCALDGISPEMGLR